MTRVTLQYFDGCPNWKTVLKNLTSLVTEGADLTVDYQLVESHEQAEELGFRGSPTILIDGVDHFADSKAPVGLACRIYRTDKGPAGSPTLDQLRAAIDRAGN